MAEINLGAIKFSWRGAYAGGTAYVVDDVVSYQGSSFVCILASTGNLPTDTTYWNVMAEGGDVATVLTTQGDILYRDGSGLQRLPKGTAGQVLKMNSGATAPEYGTLSSDFVKITTATASNVATFELDNIFSASDGYDSYQIVINQLRPATNSVELYMRFINSSGSIVTASNYIWGLFGQEVNQSASTNASQLGAGAGVSSMRIGTQGGGASNDSSHGGMRVVIDIINPTIAGYTIQQHQTTYMRANLDNLMNIMGGGCLQETSNSRGISFYFNSGNVADGSVSVYGRKA